MSFTMLVIFAIAARLVTRWVPTPLLVTTIAAASGATSAALGLLGAQITCASTRKV